MTLPTRMLPILDERWDCQGCSGCCRTMTILLDHQDRQTLREQHWDEDDHLRGVKTVVRSSLLGGRHVLAKKPDGSCVFLTEAGQCRIHEIHGADAKPSVCRMYPFQLVPLEKYSYLTLRRGCPSAAADRGRPLKDHLSALRKSGLMARFSRSQLPPPIVGRSRLDWPGWLTVADALTRLSTDDRIPLVRRLVHGLRFCSSLERCTLGSLDRASLRELVQLLEASAPDEVGELFHDRQPPSTATGFLFRQTAVHYIRSHPRFVVAKRMNRWRQLWLSVKFACGRGVVPPIDPHFPATTFPQLERPLGPLTPEVLAPLDRYFLTQAASKQFAVVGHRRSLLRSYRSLVLAYPMALWLLRLVIGDREPTIDDMIDIMVRLDRAQGTAAVDRVGNLLSGSDQLERLVAWYGR